MTITKQNKAVARRAFEEVFSGGDLAEMDRLASPDLKVHTGYPEPLSGLEKWKQAFSAFGASFSGLHFAVEDMIAEGDKVVTRWTMHGTHSGEYEGVAATGKHVMIPGVSIYRLVEGRIVEAWVVSDDPGLMQQLRGA